jgi:TolA-binding protein
MKTAVLFTLATLAIAAAAFFYIGNKNKTAEIASLKEEVSQMSELRAEVAMLKTNIVPAEELARLRKSTDEVLRLRNEVRQLRDTRSELTQQAQSAQVAAQQAQQQVAVAQAEVIAASQRAASSSNSVQSRVISGPGATGAAGTPVELLNVCINNLRMIDGAKLQWALENGKQEASVPTRQDIAPYLSDGQIPRCPAAGRYTFGQVGTPPACSIEGHMLH